MEYTNKYGDPVELDLLTEEVYRRFNAAIRIDEEYMQEVLKQFKYYNKLSDSLWMYSEEYAERSGWKYIPPTSKS
ncbi:hypothetical protein M3611_23660 [Priestia megaterium]|uniref:hypothetical protein n=1 Tax=Priestia megaterium TaxID=1404 RepID=UPI00203B26F5|nr:hypothetical protein [Priestia megaterium]MCM3155012.1 hypothetical protein [Priestia megaterium]